jgi:hypothetical protein
VVSRHSARIPRGRPWWPKIFNVALDKPDHTEIRACAVTQFDPAVVAAFLRAAHAGFPHDPDTPVLPERGDVG